MEINDVYYIFLNYIFSSLPWIKKNTHTHKNSQPSNRVAPSPSSVWIVHTFLLKGTRALGG